MHFDNPEEATCLCCGEHVALVSRSALVAHRQMVSEARADVAQWLARQPKRGRPRRVVE
jgi:hypothetical protein